MNKFFWKKSERYRGRRTRSSGRKSHAIDGYNTYKTNSTFGPRDPRGLHRSRLPPTVHRFDQTVFLLLLLPLLSPDQPNHPSGTTLFQPRPKRERWGWTQRERETERKSERGVDGGGARGLELALVRRGGEKGTVCFSANPSSPHPSRTGANVKRFRDVKADTRAAHFGPTTSARIVDTCVCVNPFVSSPRWIVQDRWGDPFVPSNVTRPCLSWFLKRRVIQFFFFARTTQVCHRWIYFRDRDRGNKVARANLSSRG